MYVILIGNTRRSSTASTKERGTGKQKKSGIPGKNEDFITIGLRSEWYVRVVNYVKAVYCFLS